VTNVVGIERFTVPAAPPIVPPQTSNAGREVDSDGHAHRHTIGGSTMPEALR